MASVWAELKRRNVVKVAVAYAVVGWLLIEVASTVFPIVQLPDWTVTFVTMLLILGFPVALILSWAYELTPEGMKRSHEVPAQQSITRVTGRKIDFVVIGALVLVLGFVIYNYVLDDDDAATGVLPNSVAVLPLENLSPDPDNAYFASGLHEEILNQLAKLRNLNVISRTSVLQYAEDRPAIQEIADALNVQSVMEGSVRYAGNRIRVTAQLIDPETGAHFWSETYDRDFSDIFAIESNIAMNIANALEVEFSLIEQERLERIPTASSAAYALYLEAISMAGGNEDTRRLIDRAIELDSDFALAYAWRASLETGGLGGVGLGISPDEAFEVERRIYEDANQALSIDPTLGLAYAALAEVHHANWRASAAEEAFQNSIRLTPNDAAVLGFYGRFKRDRGERDESIRLLERARELDPNNDFAVFQLGLAYRFFADWDAAAVAFQTMLNRNPANTTAYINLGIVEASRGNAAEAVRLLRLAEQLGETTIFRLAQMTNAYALAGSPDDAARIFAEFERRAIQEGIGDAWWAYANIAMGDYAQALQRLESAVNRRLSIDQTPLTMLWGNPWGRPELETAEVRELLDGLWDDD